MNQQSTVVGPITTSTIHRVMLDAFFKGNQGKFVGVDFIKKDGSKRSLNGRLGVRKHLKGGISTLAGSDNPYLVMYDVKTKGYRAVNLATVNQVRSQKAKFQVVG